MKTITAFGYAKINLTLDVIKKRPDGYHEVEMILQSLDLKDTVMLTENSNDAATPRVMLSCTPEIPELSLGDDNLILRAVHLFCAYFSITPSLSINLHKEIPIAAGLAGGSADAAATLHALNDFYGTNAPLSLLQTLGKQLGADVPYCLQCGTMLAQGIGERLTVLSDAPYYHYLLVKPEGGISTKLIYDTIDSHTALSHPDTGAVLRAIAAKDRNAFVSSLCNIMEPVTGSFCPEISSIKNRLLSLGADAALMSGSGPCVYALFSEENNALYAKQILSEELTTCRLYLAKPYHPNKC